MKDQGTVYLIVPGQDDTMDEQFMEDKSLENQGALDVIKGVFAGRKEVETDTTKVRQQINNYVDIVKNVAANEENNEESIKLSEINLSLTLSAKGNIGIASTSAEAGIKLIFKRG